MPVTMHPSLEKEINLLAGLAKRPTVQAVINRTGSAKPEMGKVLPFESEPRLYWIEKD